jgi:tripartite-type tricarboxylate transporter receptor subunit TctC
MTRRAKLFLLALLSLAFAIAAAGFAHAQTSSPAWPNRPIRIFVGFPPGGVADAIPRKLQQLLAEALRQSVIIENKPGGAGLIAMDAIAKGDDHTFGVMTLQNQTVAAVRATMPYDPRADLHGVVVFGRTASVLVVNDELPVKTVPELIAYARANPGKLFAASSGNATGQHFAIESLKLGAAIDVVHVPYRGVAPAFTDLISGRVQIMFGTYGSTRQHWESGKVRPLAVSTPKRFSYMPDLPTMAEVSGIADFSLTEWYALVAPTAVPPQARERLGRILNDIMTKPDYGEFNQRFGLEYEPLTPEETQAFMDDELTRASVIAKRAGIRFEQ